MKQFQIDFFPGHLTFSLRDKFFVGIGIERKIEIGPLELYCYGFTIYLGYLAVHLGITWGS